ncbi:GAF domain-containing protein [Halomonas saccharevitans]|uniref:histidine kinase n=1 Tax=Halomonas saccharevitans TaxID=416872 RepID=A0A1I6ZVG4_9GAMM|nr:GAF domain-containing protein [Halomonas saccharevitans]SFT66673.1 Signal transduction histidine kinase [Halomonas saccharevitans]
MKPPVPENDTARLAALEALGVMDSARDAGFDQLVELAQEFFEVPIALVSLVAEDRQWFKACVGLEVRETSREVSFCAHAVAALQPLVVPDAREDVRFKDNPLVTGEPGIRFYAGHPLFPDGEHAVGTLCLIDTHPREFSARDRRLLGRLAGQVEALLRKHQLRMQQEAQQRELVTLNLRLSEAGDRLAKERQLLRSVLDGSRDPIYARSRSGRYLAANTACLSLLEGSSGRAMEEGTPQLPAEVQARLDAAEAEVIASGVAQQISLPPLRGRHHELQLGPLRDEEGEIGGVVGVARDTTEALRQASLIRVLHRGITDYQALMSGHQLWDFLMEALRELTDSEYALIGEVNEDAGQPALKIHSITDLSWNEESRLLMERLRNGDMTLSNPRSLLGRVFAHGEVVMTDNLAEHPHRGGFPPGHPPLHNYLGVPIFDGQRPIGMFAIANGRRRYDQALLEWLEPFTATCALLINLYRQMAEREGYIEALSTARDSADRANRAKSEFLSSMSHELRTPLNAILGFAQLLEGGKRHPLEARQQRQVAQIARSGQHLLELINQTLDLARVEAGQLSLSMEALSLVEVADDATHALEATAKAHDIALHQQIHGPLPAVYADYTRLKQVLLNLLSNAIKYNRPGGRVCLEAAAEEECLRFTVRDNGQGIRDEGLALLFQPFQRLGAERSGIEGTGIGLAITRQLLEAMHATIEVESVEGQGSAFHCRLMLADVDQRVVNRAEKKGAGAPEEVAARIVYIEDNPANQRLMEDIFEEWQACQLQIYPSAELALPHIEAEPPDLVLMDLNLSGMNGYHALERLRQLPLMRALPVIALSANAMPADIKRGLAAGFDDYLTKPLELASFFATLSRHLSSFEGNPDAF